MILKNVRDAEVAGKRVLLRVDFNVPLTDDGKIEDDKRIKAAIPTIELLKQKGVAHITLASHLGRPDGKVIESLRTAILFARLSELTDTTHIDMLENVRFDAREETNDESFAKELAAYGDVFINDAFADCHRVHASIVGVAKFLPSYAGLLVEREVREISKAFTPAEPALAIVGGAKFETKVPLLEKLLDTYGQIFLGGALANDMLKARGVDVKQSLVSNSAVPSEMVADSRILVPTDFVWKDEKIVDIGPDTAHHWATLLSTQRFVLWNGPLGVYEHGEVAGTDTVAQALASSQATAVIGGGDTEEAIAKTPFDSSRVFISTGGGAMLELITKGTLPGLEPLRIS